MLLMAVVSAVGLAAWRAPPAGDRRRVDLHAGVLGLRAGHPRCPAVLRDRVLAARFRPGLPRSRAWGPAGLDWSTSPRAASCLYGSLIGGVLGLVAFLIKHKLPLLATLDLVTPSLMLGLAIGRLGCFLNGCCFGGACDLPWAVTFPALSPPHVHQVERGRPLSTA